MHMQHCTSFRLACATRSSPDDRVMLMFITSSAPANGSGAAPFTPSSSSLSARCPGSVFSAIISSRSDTTDLTAPASFTSCFCTALAWFLGSFFMAFTPSITAPTRNGSGSFWRLSSTVRWTSLITAVSTSSASTATALCIAGLSPPSAEHHATNFSRPLRTCRQRPMASSGGGAEFMKTRVNFWASVETTSAVPIRESLALTPAGACSGFSTGVATARLLSSRYPSSSLKAPIASLWGDIAAIPIRAWLHCLCGSVG
mmetsp:Transcript_5244/g.13218  ORF Transcript_5244/g.13218 Transcript_5244/m.13218 type:complete len:258 (+) Transcript_5244:2594-3367(+)